jgi:hypothetical protein
MALLQRGTLLAQYPFRLHGGTVSGDRALWGRGDRCNLFAGQGGIDAKNGVPSGHLNPSAWILPKKDGGMSAFTTIAGRGAVVAAAALGRNIDASASGAATLTASLELVVSASATINGVGSLTANAVANLFGDASAAGTATVSGTLTANGNMAASAAGVGALNLTSYAVGFMACEITPFTELSPQNLASAVWSANSASFNDPSTMGEKLNDAGSAGNPWTTVIEDGMTAEEILKLILSVTSGDATGMEGATVTFKSQDGTKNRLVATISGGNRTVTSKDVT